MERRFYLVDAQVLPEVFLKVVRAKELLASGEARSISAATRAVDLSRSAFYKYKDCIFDSENDREVVTVMATLRDETGALQSLLAGSSCPSTAVGYYRADDLPDTCTYSHGASTQAADPAAPAEEAPQQTVIPIDTSNLDTD